MKHITNIINNKHISHLEPWDENEISYIENLDINSTAIEEWSENEIFEIRSSTKKG